MANGFPTQSRLRALQGPEQFRSDPIRENNLKFKSGQGGGFALKCPPYSHLEKLMLKSKYPFSLHDYVG